MPRSIRLPCRPAAAAPLAAAALALATLAAPAVADDLRVAEDADQITIETDALAAAVRKHGYVSGVAAGSLLDKATGLRDPGFGLDIVDWLMEPGSDEAYRDGLDEELVYAFDNLYHGRRPKRSIEGPQICTRAGRLEPRVLRGQGFAAVEQSYQYHTAAPGRNTGSVWTQRLLFLPGKRYFLSSDSVRTVNASDALFQRIDMPGHVKHTRGDTFSEIYLSYYGVVPAEEFLEDFPPDERFLYVRDDERLPERFIRAVHLRDPRTGGDGPWLAGMTLQPAVVSEAWCHQRGYVCMIEEYGGRPIAEGETFSAAFVVGYFDSIDEMHAVYDQYAGHTRLEVDETGWRLLE